MTQKEVYDQIASISDESNIRLSALEKQLVADIIKTVNQSLIVTSGKVTGLTKPAGEIVTKSIKEFVKSKAYKNSIARILKDLDVATGDKLSVYKDEGLEISKANLTKAQSLVLDEYLDALGENGLNARFNQTMRQLIYDNVRNNVSQNELQKALTQKIESGKAPSDLAKYTKSAVRQAADAYTSAVDTEIMKKFGDRVTHILVVGTLIETSSPQCRQAVEKYDREIPVEELDKWIAYAQENGGSADLTQQNLPTLKAHYGCRHQFLPIIKS